MYKKILFLFVALVLSFSVSFVRVEMLETGEKTVELAKYNSDKEKKNCEGLFGDPDDEESFAHLLQIAFTIMKFAGPLLCIIFSSIEFITRGKNACMMFGTTIPTASKRFITIARPSILG
jgi:hypothetical protein